MKKKILLIITLILFLIIGFWQKFYAFTPLESTDRQIKVHLVGAVINPGVYELQDDARIGDLLEEAGGLHSDADAESLNYAEKMVDGQQVDIPFIVFEAAETGESINVEKKASGIHAMTQGDWTAIKGIGDKTAVIIMDYLKSNPKATVDDLINVSGIGPSKLEDIKEHLAP